MLRSILESLGDLFKNKIVDVVMAMVAAVFLLPEIRSFSELDPVSLTQVFTYLISVILIAVFFQVIGVLCTWLSETIPPNLAVEISHTIAQISKSDQGLIVRMIAPLEIKNNEHSELTDCYAVLTKANYADTHRPVLSTNMGEKHIRWENHQECKISINAHGGEAILEVYEVTMLHHSDDRVSLDFSNFCFCEKSAQKANDILPMAHWEIEILIRGKLNGKEVRSKEFIGYVDVNVSESTIHDVSILRDRTSLSTGDKPGPTHSKSDVVKIRSPHTRKER